MIDAKELRIGNIVGYYYDWYEDDGNKITEYKEMPVCGIETVYTSTGPKVYLQDKLRTNLHDVNVLKLIPIPLTEEILMRCGFVDIQDGWYELVKPPLNFNWNIYDKQLRALGYRHSHIMYLHQLQNLYFALTGEELNIQL